MQIRIIGCGAMGSAIAQALLEAGQKVSLYDKHEMRAAALAQDLHITKVSTPLEALVSGDALVLAVKPQDFAVVSSELKEFHDGLVVSILTGISIEPLKEAFPRCTVLRMMPNLAVRYGEGVVVLAEDPTLIQFQKKLEELFAPLGMIQWLPEKNFDAATALIGSGPAFVFTLVESMVDAAIEMGLSAEMGYALVKQMISGAMTMLYESPELPAELRWKVCSPGGTTIAGLRALESKGVRGALIETFLASYQRAKELGNTPILY